MKTKQSKTLIQSIREYVKHGTGYYAPIGYYLYDDLSVRRYAISKIIFPCDIDLFGNKSLINSAKQLGIEIFNPKGEWNGYSFTKIRLHAKIENKRMLNKLIAAYENKPITKELSDEDRTEKWAKRLAKLTDITVEEAKQIAMEKINYKIDKIDMMIERSNERPSRKRDALIRRMERDNPLRRIENKEHAIAIISASERHRNTNYEDMLEEGRELAILGDIDKGEVKQYARMNYAR